MKLEGLDEQLYPPFSNQPTDRMFLEMISQDHNSSPAPTPKLQITPLFQMFFSRDWDGRRRSFDKEGAGYNSVGGAGHLFWEKEEYSVDK